MLARSSSWFLSAFIAVLISGCAIDRQRASAQQNVKAAEVYVQLGAGYLEQGEIEVALEKINQALKLNPSSVSAHSLLGVLYERIGNIDLARTHYARSVELNPANGLAQNNFGVFLCRNGEFGAAERHFVAAVKDPFYATPAAAMTNAGSCALQNDNAARAESLLRRALEYDATFADALLVMIRLMHSKESYLKARAFLQRFEATRASSAESLWMGWQVEGALGDERAARSYRTALIQKFPDSAEAARAQEKRER